MYQTYCQRNVFWPQYFAWPDVLFASGTVGTIVCFGWWIIDCVRATIRGEPAYPLFGQPENRAWLLARGVAGALANLSAWVALSYLSVAVANTIMFTSPFFTMFFAFLFLGQRWRWFDSLITVLCVAGVVLVSRPGSFLPEWGIPGDEASVVCTAAPQYPDGWPPKATASSSWAQNALGLAAAACFSLASVWL